MNTLHGQRILVTGATGGLGPTLVETCLALGANVVAAARLRTKLDSLRASLDHHDRLDVAEADVSTAQGAKALVSALDRAGGIDGVVHAVGGFAYGHLADLTEEEIERLVAAYVFSALWIVRAALGAMKAKGGSIVLIGADRAYEPAGGFSVYGAAKSFASHLAQAVALEAKADGVRINVIAPGTIDTQENRAAMPAEDPSKWVSPKTIAKSTVWLLGQDSTDVSGSIVRCVG